MSDMTDIDEPTDYPAEYLRRRQAEVAARLGLDPILGYPPGFCLDCDPVECDEVTVERMTTAEVPVDDQTVADFMATQEGMGQS